METPLRPTAGNTSTPPTTLQHRTDDATHTAQTSIDLDGSESAVFSSSPFVDCAGSAVTDDENASPDTIRMAMKSPIERDHTSPMRMLKSRTSTSPVPSPLKLSFGTTKAQRRISSPAKRFPVKPIEAAKPASPGQAAPEQGHSEDSPAEPRSTMDLEEALHNNEGLKKAMEILEDSDNESHDGHISEDTLIGMAGASEPQEEAHNFDDTMASAFSDFSAVPDMTMFAKIGHSPSKYASMGAPTPRRMVMSTPATARRPAPIQEQSPNSPTPRRHGFGKSRDDGNTTNLLDFTDQINGFSGRPSSMISPRRLSPSKTMPDVGGYNTYGVTPSRQHNMSNLLDFDIPPAPTPRSMPSITPRELESLKSNFLSQISSLKASLSGKEAEVNSLKTAVGDAEKRVGESMEQVREERDMKEQLQAEREEWEKRGREMEAVLRNVKEEIVHGERQCNDLEQQCDQLEGRLQESEGRREAAEMMAQEAEGKIAALRAGKLSPSSDSFESKGDCSCGGNGNRAVEVAVEKVSRELHILYKEKHETKVSALKKSYERKWEKRIKELEGQIEDISREKADLTREMTMTEREPKMLSTESPEVIERHAAQEAKMQELEAELEGLSQVVSSIKQDNSDLRYKLDEERVEKGKLVAAVDEMIPLVAAFDDMLAKMDNIPATPTSTSKHRDFVDNNPQPTKGAVENFRGSISRASGLRAPGKSQIGRGGFGIAPPPSASAIHRRNESTAAATVTSRPGSGLGYRRRVD